MKKFKNKTKMQSFYFTSKIQYLFNISYFQDQVAKTIVTVTKTWIMFSTTIFSRFFKRCNKKYMEQGRQLSTKGEVIKITSYNIWNGSGVTMASNFKLHETKTTPN